MSVTRTHTLTVVIPALNEEEAIGSTISRCLNAREEIKRIAGLDDLEIIVVSDGSTDRTVEIARGFEEVKVIVFEQNRGYGAAIKEGFRQGRGDLVGFIDADGTCDPIYFAEMCRLIIEDEVDIALGSRMGPTSKMPPTRRLGNRIFAILLGLLCGQQVVDTTSGMRVLRRRALAMLYPLPDGLHFTPSMSARAMLNGLRVVEIPMHYEERIGISKLRVISDGIRFLRTIVDGVLCYRPERLFLIGFVACMLVGLFLAAYPSEFYFRNRMLEEWMIYRFVACVILVSTGFLMLCAAGLAHRMATFGPRLRSGYTFWAPLVARLFQGKLVGVFTAVILGLTLWAIYPGLVQFVRTGHVTLHWSRLLAGSLGMLVAVQALVTYVLMRVLMIWQWQQSAIERYQREEAEIGRLPHGATGAVVAGLVLAAPVSSPPAERSMVQTS